MALYYSERVLGALAVQIETGRPVLSMLKANEIFDQSSPLRIALAIKAGDAVATCKKIKSKRDLAVVKKILHGARVRDLNDKEREIAFTLDDRISIEDCHVFQRDKCTKYRPVLINLRRKREKGQNKKSQKRSKLSSTKAIN